MRLGIYYNIYLLTQDIRRDREMDRVLCEFNLRLIDTECMKRKNFDPSDQYVELCWS